MDYSKMTNQEIDALIAEKVMGWTYCPGNEPSMMPDIYSINDEESIRCSDWHPSTDLNDAVRALEEWRDIRGNKYVEIITGSISSEYEVHLYEENIKFCSHYQSSLARAICEALLKAKE